MDRVEIHSETKISISSMVVVIIGMEVVTDLVILEIAMLSK